MVFLRNITVSGSSANKGGVIYAELINKLSVENSSFTNAESFEEGAIIHAVDVDDLQVSTVSVTNALTFDKAAIFCLRSNLKMI